MIKIKIKKIQTDSILPQKQHEEDVGFDAYINRFKSPSNQEKGKIITWDRKDAYLHELQRIICCLGFSTEIPKGYYGQIVSRSGLAIWDGLTILNSPGIIDSSYRNEWMAIVINLSNKEVKLEIGDRICQIIFKKDINIEFEKVEKLNESKRNLNCFGSTGKK